MSMSPTSAAPQEIEYNAALKTLDAFVAEMVSRHSDEFTMHCARPSVVHALQVLSAFAPQPKESIPDE